MKLEWTDDPLAERWMEHFGLTWDVQVVPIDKIDNHASLVNNARMETPLNQAVVDEYAVAMQDGAVFPMAVLFYVPSTRMFVIAGGNHRKGGVVANGVKEMTCYVVTTTDPMILDMLPRILNRGHGVRQDKTEALLHAMRAVTEWGKDAKVAAVMFGLRYEYVRNAIRIRDIEDVLAAKGVPVNRLNKTQIEALGPVSENENVLVATANFVAKNGMKVEDAKELVNSIKNKKTEVSQIGVIAEHEQRLGLQESESRKTSDIRKQLYSRVTSAESFFSERHIHMYGVHDHEEKQKLGARLHALSKRIGELAESASEDEASNRKATRKRA